MEPQSGLIRWPITKNLTLISLSVLFYVVLYIYQLKPLRIDSEASQPICNLLNLFAERLRFKIKEV
jgi:hypothetical protein